MAHIDYYLATISPYTYLAGTRMEEVAAKHGATITYKPLDIMQLFARTGGQPPAQRHPNRQEWRMQEVARWRDHLKMLMNLKPAHWPTNPAPSSYAIIAAQNAGGGDLGRLAHAILRSCWADEKDIADDAVIRDCLTEAGFDHGLADSGLMDGADTYARNLDQAVLAGVFGSPFYIVDDDARFWGQDRMDFLDRDLAARA
jgi:2-hydroxychromene-2-carboxylate isomerase